MKTLMLLAVPDEEMYEFSCEELGTCDDSCSPPARDDCLIPQEAEPTPVPLETLPNTGPPLVQTLAVAAVLAFTIAVFALWWAGRRNP